MSGICLNFSVTASGDNVSKFKHIFVISALQLSVLFDASYSFINLVYENKVFVLCSFF